MTSNVKVLKIKSVVNDFLEDAIQENYDGIVMIAVKDDEYNVFISPQMGKLKLLGALSIAQSDIIYSGDEEYI